MARYVAFLRGVSPMNLRMQDLAACLEHGGFTNVRTVLASGNVVFDSRAASDATLERKIEAAMQAQLGRAFYTIVRQIESLEELLESDPYAAFRLPKDAKRVVTFLRDVPKVAGKLPIETDGARILAISGRECFTAYTPSPRGPVFMTLIQKTLGENVTTRTWETIKKCVAVARTR